jgi:hypothetical protein
VPPGEMMSEVGPRSASRSVGAAVVLALRREVGQSGVGL